MIVAFDLNQGIGVQNLLPWHIPADLKHFKSLTSGCPVIMGRLTSESILDQLGTNLPNRRSLVLSRSMLHCPGIETFSSVQEILDLKLPNAWVIGGTQIYKLFLDHCQELHITRVNSVYPCDKFFPAYQHLFQKTSFESPSPDYCFEVWNRVQNL